MNKSVAILLSAALLGQVAPSFGEADFVDHLEDGPALVVQAETLHQLEIGMTRHQIYHLLGEPHYARGVRARSWSYVYDIRRNEGVGRPLCQLDIHFERGVVSELRWNSAACAQAAQE